MIASDHHQIAQLIDAVSRIRGRLKSCYAPAARESGLSEFEMTVLTAVTGARTPPTVAQIGRSLGHPRQVIQRAANLLLGAGLIAAGDNPDHKRAPLLIATPSGEAMAAAATAHAEAISEQLMTRIDGAEVIEVTAALNRLREQLEAFAREAA